MDVTDEHSREPAPRYTGLNGDYDEADDWGDGGPPCNGPWPHSWIVSDEDENYCYCERCGCCEY